MTELEWFNKYAGYYDPMEKTREEIVDIIQMRVFDYDTLPEQPAGATPGDLADKIIAQAKAQEVLNK